MANEDNAPGKVFFPNLDGLRTIAFLLVYMQHGFSNVFLFFRGKYQYLDRFFNLIANGSNGVSVFFVLSGFLITYLILAETKLKGNVNVPYFYLRRTLRIWPLYYCVITFAFIVYPALKHFIGIDSFNGARPIYYFFFLSNFDLIHIQRYFRGHDAMSGNITWSVAIEEQFYLIWPLLFYFLPKKLYKWVFPTVIAISIIARYYFFNDVPSSYSHSLCVCGDLAVGGMAAYLAINHENFKAFFEKLPRWSIILCYMLGIGWLMNYINFGIFGIFCRLLNTLFYAFIILEQNYSRHSFYKFSNFSLLTFWGTYTYGLYLLHPIGLLIMDISFRMLHIPYASMLPYAIFSGFASLAISLLLSYLSYEYFEKRFLKLKKKFSFVKSAH